MPTSLSAMLALFNDNTSGDISAADGRTVIQGLYDWVPTEAKYMAGRLPSESAHASDDFFSAYSGYTEQTPTGTAVWAAGNGGLGVTYDDQSANDVAVTVKAIPGGPPLTIQTAWYSLVTQTSNPGIGLVFTDGTTGGANIAGFGYLSGFGATGLSGTINSVTAVGATNVIDRASLFQALIHVRLVWKSSNTFAYAYSVDGSTWTDFAQADLSITCTPTHMGFFVSTWSQTVPMAAVFRYLRVAESDLSV